MKQISLPTRALLALLQTGVCQVRKPVANSPEVGPENLIFYERYKVDRYGLEGKPNFNILRIKKPDERYKVDRYGLEGTEFGFMAFGLYYRFPWGSPTEFVQIKGSQRRCEIMSVEVVAGRKRYQWSIKLRLV